MPSFYDEDSADAASSPSTTKSDESSDSNREDKDQDEKTALLPKSIFGGHKCKVGDIKKFEVVHIYEDEYEVKYVGKEDGKDKEESESEGESGDMKNSMDDLESSYA